MAPHHHRSLFVDQKTEAAGLLMALSKASGSGVGIAGASVQNPPGLRHNNLPKAPTSAAPAGPPRLDLPNSSKLEEHRSHLPPPPLSFCGDARAPGAMTQLDPLSPLLDPEDLLPYGRYPPLLLPSGGVGFGGFHEQHRYPYSHPYAKNRESTMTMSSIASTASSASTESTWSTTSMNLSERGGEPPSPREEGAALSYQMRWSLPHNELDMSIDHHDDADDDRPSILREAATASESEPLESILTVPLPMTSPTPPTAAGTGGRASSTSGGGPTRPRRSCPSQPAPYVIADAKINRARARSQPNVCTYPGCGMSFSTLNEFSKHCAEHVQDLRRFVDETESSSASAASSSSSS